jgi:hypothetical protein
MIVDLNLAHLTPEMSAALRQPFSAEHVGKLPKVTCKACSDKQCSTQAHKPKACPECKAYLGKHIHIDFVSHSHVTDRLLQVDPLWNWEPMAFTVDGLPALDSGGGLWVRLTIGGVTRIGYGHSGSRTGNGMKAAISDAIKVAAMRFGVGLDMWIKEEKDVPPDPVTDPEPVQQTPDGMKAQLRAQIAKVGKNQGTGIEETAADFAVWSHGGDIRTAPEKHLAEYLGHLQKKETP